MDHWDVLTTAQDKYFTSSILLLSYCLLHGSLKDISDASLPEDVLRR